MQNILNDPMVLSLLVAMLLGMVLGVERFLAHKTAGMRTYTFISMGSALFVIITRLISVQFPSAIGFDHHIPAQIVAAAGFLGVGAIFHNSQRVSGITTASGMWVAAGIGMACGFGFYKLAIIVTVLALFTFIVMWFLEKQIRKLPFDHTEDNPSL